MMCGPIVWLALALSDALHGPILARSHLFLYFLSFTFLPHIILSFYVLYFMMHYTANLGKVAPCSSFFTSFLSFIPLSFLCSVWCITLPILARSNLFRSFYIFPFLLDLADLADSYLFCATYLKSDKVASPSFYITLQSLLLFLKNDLILQIFW